VIISLTPRHRGINKLKKGINSFCLSILRTMLEK